MNIQIMHERFDRLEQLMLLAAKSVLTLSDVADLTGLSKSQIYKLICSKRIPHYRPDGRRIYFERAEIEAWLKQNHVPVFDEEQTAARAEEGGMR